MDIGAVYEFHGDDAPALPRSLKRLAPSLLGLFGGGFGLFSAYVLALFLSGLSACSCLWDPALGILVWPLVVGSVSGIAGGAFYLMKTDGGWRAHVSRWPHSFLHYHPRTAAVFRFIDFLPGTQPVLRIATVYGWASVFSKDSQSAETAPRRRMDTVAREASQQRADALQTQPRLRKGM